MVLGIQNPNSPDNMDFWIKEFGEIDLNQFDLIQKHYEGRVYRLSQENMKVIAEAIGFTANFDSSSVQNAYLDIVHGNGTVVFEMAKNTKPTDVGLRYMADRWSSSERSSSREP